MVVGLAGVVAMVVIVVQGVVMVVILVVVNEVQTCPGNASVGDSIGVMVEMAEVGDGGGGDVAVLGEGKGGWRLVLVVEVNGYTVGDGIASGTGGCSL